MFKTIRKRTWQPLLATFLALATTGLAVRTTYARPQMGLNIGLQSGAIKGFTDAMKTSRSYWGTMSDLNSGAPRDADGWPTTDAQIMVWEGIPNNQGTYRVTFNGQANLAVPLGYATFSGQSYNSGSNLTTVTMQVVGSDSQNFIMQFTNTRRTSGSALNTGVTNVKVIRPTTVGGSTPYADTVTFTPYLKNAVNNYDHIRFMEGTNFNIQQTWADRTRPNEATQNKFLGGQSGAEGNGVAWEYKIMFANETNKNLWICIPALVDDDYILRVARMVKYGSDGTNPYTSTQANPVYPPLNSSLKCYIEYSNETWNYSFSAFQQIIGLANSRISANQNTSINFDGAIHDNDPSTNDNDLLKVHRYSAQRIKEISDIFRGVFGNSDMPANTTSEPRIRPLYEYQYANLNGSALDGLEYLQTYYNNGDGQQNVTTPHPVTYFLYGSGGSPYYSNNLSNDVNNDPATSIDQIFNAGIENDYTDIVRGTAIWPKYFGLKTIGYEGGMAVGGDGMRNNAYASRWDARSKPWELDAMNRYSQAGGDAFTFGTYAQWDTIEGQASSPLQQGIGDITSGAYTLGAPNIGTLVPQNSVPGSSTDPDGRRRYFRSGSKEYYAVRTDNPGNYTLTLSYSAWNTNDKIQVVVNGDVISAPVSLPSTGSFGNDNTGTVTFPVTLKQGINGVRLYAPSGDMTIISLAFGNGGTTPTPTPTPTPAAGDGNPYGGTARAIPGTIQAEDFNTGGQGVAYNDASTANEGGQYRTGEGVDIEATTDTGGGYNVGWTSTGEWLKYTVNVASAGTYNIRVRVAGTGGGTMHIEFGGVNKTGNLTIPVTGGWQTWQDVTANNVSLSAGAQTMRIVIDGSNGYNVNYVQVSSVATNPTPTPTPPPTSGVTDGATYEIEPRHAPGQRLSVAGASTADGASIQLATDVSGGHQRWKFESVGSGYYKITAQNSGKALDVAANSQANGAGIIQWTYGAGTNQQWSVTDLGGGYFKILSRSSGKSLDASGSTDGTGIQQWDYFGNLNQQWRLEDILAGGGTITLVDRTDETGGLITARGDYASMGEGKAQAFDNSTSTKWLDLSSTSWIQYQFANNASYVITQYTITSANDYPTRDPKNWTLKGSNDGTNFVTVDTRTNQTFGGRFQKNTYATNNTTAYKMYRLDITANSGDSLTQLSEIELLGPSSGSGSLAKTNTTNTKTATPASSVKGF